MKFTKFSRRIVAGVFTFALSPLAAFSIGDAHPDDFEDKLDAASEYIQTIRSDSHAPPPTQERITAYNKTPINNGSMMLYTPMPDTLDTPEIPEIPDTPDLPDIPVPITDDIPIMSQNISSSNTMPNSRTPHKGATIQQTYRPAQSGNYIKLPNGGQVRNGTESVSDENLLKEAAKPLGFAPTRYADNAAPQVLILHTHTTESFADVSGTFRTDDAKRSVVAVGARIAEEIAKAGFGVIHDGTVHDYPVFNDSYSRSAQTVQAILSQYPTIRIVLDIHRDAIESNGKPVAVVKEVNGKKAAQIMIMSACDNGHWNVPDWRDNYRFATRLQSQLETDTTGLARALWVRYANYNMHLAPAALLIEVGSHGNTLEQALYAGELLGQSMGNLLNELAQSP
ncbi:MAG: stage II sporulation protein P [Oscillospiraceae bacterium]|nr:stage II sporulation protein P [Oscillospiraceae bacterium]